MSQSEARRSERLTPLLAAAFGVRPAEQSTPPDPAIDERFELGDEVGRGGMGVVYRARDRRMGRDIAIKLLRDEHASRQDLIARFIEEAQICGQLQHPGIVPVHEMSALDAPRPFFTMKLIEGRTLADELQRSHPTRDLGRLLAVFESVAQAVAYAHDRGVVHRDLKPSNVMVGAYGEVQVMDWGLAKVLGREESPKRIPSSVTTVRTEDASTRSMSGSVMGSPAYMPPEQARGELDAVRETADVFSLGAMLCEILTGETPYGRRTSADVRASARDGDVSAAIAELDACGADDALRALATRCLAPAPSDRPRAASEIATSIRDYRRSVEQRAKAAEVHAARSEERAIAAARVRRRTLLAATTVLVAILVGVVGYVAYRNDRDHRARRAERGLGDALRETLVAVESAEARADDAAAWSRADEAAQRLAALATSTPAPPDLVLRATRESRRIRDAAARAARQRDLAAAIDAGRALTWFAADAPDPLALIDAFRRFGLPLATVEPADAASRVNASPIREEIIAGLVLLDGRVEPALRHRIRRMVEAVDPGPVWRELLALRATRDLQRTRKLATTDPGALTAAQASLVAHALFDFAGQTVVSAAEAASFLSGWCLIQPGDYWNLATTAFYLLRDEPPRFRDARDYARAALALRPDGATPWTLYGRALNGLRLPEAAGNAYHNALARNPRLVDAVVGLSRAHLGTDRIADAIAVLEDDGGGALRTAEGQRAYADALVAAGRPDDAEVALRRAIRMPNPGTPQVRAILHVQLSERLVRSGRIEGAHAEARRAVELAPRLATAQNQLGIALSRLGLSSAAIDAFEAAIEYGPTVSEPHGNLGIVLWRTYRPHEALRAFQRGATLARITAADHPGDGHFAKIAERMEQQAAKALVRASAIDALRDVERATPEILGEHRDYVWRYADQRGDHRSLVRWAERVLAGAPSLDDALFHLERGALAALRIASAPERPAVARAQARARACEWCDRALDVLDDAVADDRLPVPRAVALLRTWSSRGAFGVMRRALANDDLDPDGDAFEAIWAKLRQVSADVRADG